MSRKGHVNPDKFTVWPYDWIFGDGSKNDDLVPVCLPRPFLRLLQSNLDRYIWWSSYRGMDNEKILLTEEEKTIIQHGCIALLQEKNCGNEVVVETEYIFRWIKENKKECKMSNCQCGCCCSDSSESINVIEEVNSIPETLPEDLPPATTSSEKQDKCKRATVFVLAFQQLVHTLAFGLEGVNPTTLSVIALVSANPIVQTIAFLWEAIVAVMTFFAPQVRAELEEVATSNELREELICILYNSESSSQAKPLFHTAVMDFASGYSPTTKVFLSKLILYPLQFSIMYYTSGIFHTAVPEQDCTFCDDTYPVPNEPGNWELIEEGIYLAPVASLEWKNGQNTVQRSEENIFGWSIAPTSDNYVKRTVQNPVPISAFTDDATTQRGFLVKLLYTPNLTAHGLSTYLTGGTVMHGNQPYSTTEAYYLVSDGTHVNWLSSLENILGEGVFNHQVIGVNDMRRVWFQWACRRIDASQPAALIAQLWLILEQTI